MESFGGCYSAKDERSRRLCELLHRDDGDDFFEMVRSKRAVSFGYRGIEALTHRKGGKRWLAFGAIHNPIYLPAILDPSLFMQRRSSSAGCNRRGPQDPRQEVQECSAKDDKPSKEISQRFKSYICHLF
jgi:hypothetical protein